MNVLIWHVHGSWTTSFVQGSHRYLVPVVHGRTAVGRGRARTWTWPDNVEELRPEQLREEQIDVVVLQAPEHELLAAEWLGRRPGRDIPTIWLEHNAPRSPASEMRHPAADRDDVTVVHVTHTNRLFWDCGTTDCRVIEHGVVDPGWLYRGDVERAAVVVNEPVRRGRIVGADLLARFATEISIDLFGMGTRSLAEQGASGDRLRAYGDIPQQQLHPMVARRRAYLHPVRWTSLGLSLVEAMTMGMPVVALATTEVPDAVPSTAGVVSNDLDVLAAGLRQLMSDPAMARASGARAREAALDRFGLKRFLDDWDALLEEVTA